MNLCAFSTNVAQSLAGKSRVSSNDAATSHPQGRLHCQSTSSCANGSRVEASKRRNVSSSGRGQGFRRGIRAPVSQSHQTLASSATQSGAPTLSVDVNHTPTRSVCSESDDEIDC